MILQICKKTQVGFIIRQGIFKTIFYVNPVYIYMLCILYTFMYGFTIVK